MSRQYPFASSLSSPRRHIYLRATSLETWDTLNVMPLTGAGTAIPATFRVRHPAPNTARVFAVKFRSCSHSAAQPDGRCLASDIKNFCAIWVCRIRYRSLASVQQIIASPNNAEVRLFACQHVSIISPNRLSCQVPIPSPRPLHARIPAPAPDAARRNADSARWAARTSRRKNIRCATSRAPDGAATR